MYNDIKNKKNYCTRWIIFTIALLVVSFAIIGSCLVLKMFKFTDLMTMSVIVASVVALSTITLICVTVVSVKAMKASKIEERCDANRELLQKLVEAVAQPVEEKKEHIHKLSGELKIKK
ncbi:MAG: hypothetical protein J6Q78_04555 [Clostridia bacterium]|nr:hypothetical protein [Clostridia bacterium]